MKTYFSRIAVSHLLVALLLVAQFAFAGPLEHTAKASPPASLQEYHPMYFGSFNTGVKASDVYTEGHISFVVPLWSSIGADGSLGGGYAFLEPYVSLGEQGELATSLGLGWRYLFNDQPVSALKSDARAGFLTEGFYVSANVFVDNLRTQFDNDFWQLGLGAEIGSRYLEVRGNYYLPFDSSRKLAERSTSTQKFTSQSRSSSTRMESSATPTSDPFATGHTIQQDANLTTTAVTATRTTTTRTTVKTITSLFEEPMEGWDVEAAFFIPGLDQYLDVSLLVGYYSFDNQPFGPQRGGAGNTEGFKAGIEIRPVPALVLTGMWYEDEGLTGSDWVAGLGLQIPLGKEWKDAFKPRRRHLAERLAEPVARQNAAIKTARNYDVDQQVSHQTSTRTAVRRHVVSQGPGRITIKDDIVFVNNGAAVGNGIEAGSATGDGTAEQPFDTIQAGADLAGNRNVVTQDVWSVYTQGTATPYLESVTISASTHFISSSTPIISSYDGSTFGGSTPRPLVQGGFAGDADFFIPGSTSASVVSIAGYEIVGGYDSAASVPANIPGGIAAGDGAGISMDNIDQVHFENNLVESVPFSAIYISHDSHLMATIIGNTSNGGFGDGINISSLGNLTGQIADNKVNLFAGTGISVKSAANIVGDITGNFITFTGMDAIFVQSAGNITGDITNNTVSDTTGNGIHALVGGTFRGNLSHNTFSETTYSGIAVTADQFIGNIASNTADINYGGHGLSIDARTFAGNISQNTFNNSFGSGIFVDIDENFTGNVTGNTTSTNGDNGFELFILGDFSGQVSNNTAMDNVADGISILVVGHVTGDITGNQTNGNMNGLYLDLGAFSGNISNNTASGNDNVGITVLMDGAYNGDFSHNTASSNLQTGVTFTGENFTGNFSHNTASGNTITGLNVSFYQNFMGDWSNNTTHDNDGLGSYLWIGYDFNGNISNNTANNNGLGGWTGYTLFNFTGNVTGNTTNNNGSAAFSNGFTLSLTGSGVFDGAVTGNQSHNNSGFGFASGATVISGDTITGPNNASGNGGGNFNTLIGLPIITETP